MSLSLVKEQTISLEKAKGASLRSVTLGLGWDAASTGLLGKLFGAVGDIDLDASCVVMNKARKAIDQVWFGQLKSNCGKIRHSGDNRTGDGDGDDESITVNLAELSPDVDSLVFTVNSFTGLNFKKVKNAYCRIIDTDTQEELARIELSDKGAHTGLIMASLKRKGNDWQFKAIGKATHGLSVNDLVNEAAQVVMV
jgi:tellurium resistance protein TerZ